MTAVVRQTTPAVRPDDVLGALDVVAGLTLPAPPKATRTAQGLPDGSDTRTRVMAGPDVRAAATPPDISGTTLPARSPVGEVVPEKSGGADGHDTANDPVSRSEGPAGSTKRCTWPGCPEVVPFRVTPDGADLVCPRGHRVTGFNTPAEGAATNGEAHPSTGGRVRGTL